MTPMNDVTRSLRGMGEGERPGTVIGPYKLMEQIGEGGMGLVFVAEQQQPLRRRVALKIIKPASSRMMCLLARRRRRCRV